MIMGLDEGFYVPMRSSYRGLKAIDSLLLCEGTRVAEEREGAGLRERAYVHDMSYCRPIQLIGPYKKVHATLCMITDPECLLVAELMGGLGQEQEGGAPKGGIFERTIIVHKPHCFPREPLGVVDITVSIYKENIQVSCGFSPPTFSTSLDFTNPITLLLLS